MPARKPFNQLDPFNENQDDFQTREIRHSRSRSSNNPFVNVEEPDKEKSKKKHFIILCIVLALIILGAVAALIFLPRSGSSDPTISEDPLVNPTGREASSEYTTDIEDPALRAREQDKLDTLLLLVVDEDWEYANATFETIFPDYLDTCGRYEYYRIALLLADNIENFTVSRDIAEARRDALFEKCDSSRNE